MSTRVLCIAVGSLSFLVGCASPSGQPDAADQAATSAKLSVNQLGRAQNADFVFCIEGQCAKRTLKVVALPPEVKRDVSQIAPVAPVIREPETHSIHFRWAWSRLDKSGTQEFESLLAAVKGTQFKKIVIAGRTDPTGGLKFNEKLALLRAETVKAALVSAGISPSVIETRTQEPCCDGDLKSSPRIMQQLRRTDIKITITK